MWQTRYGTCIYTSASGYKVYQNLFYRWLTLDSSALQTVLNRRAPYKPVLYYLPALTLMARTLPNSICLLGLGGAGVPHMLHHHNPSQSITAVDNSEEIIQLAKQFFMIDRIPTLKLIHQNAFHFLKHSSTQYPHLLVDLYDANFFPKDCANEAFFMLCKERISDEGFVAINLANRKEQWPIFQLIKKQFMNTLVIPVKKSSNIVVIASKQEQQESLIYNVEQSGVLKNIKWDQFWGYVSNEY